MNDFLLYGITRAMKITFKRKNELCDKSQSQSITEGSIGKALMHFFFPILLGTFFQQLYNTVDAVIVGQFVGKEALAAVGGGAAIFINLLVGFFIGLSSGAGVLISQFYGAKNDKDVSLAVHTSIALSLLGGFIMTVLGISLSRPMLYLTKTTSDTIDLASLYLNIFFTGTIPMLVYNMCSGILRAAGDSKTPLVILIISCVTNIFLDLVFVVFFRLGVAGVAIATVLCQVVSAVISIIKLSGIKDSYRLDLKKIHLTPHMLSAILKIGFPAGIQSVLYTSSNLIIQTNINSFGTDSIAAWAVYGKIDCIFWMVISAFGIAVTTFAGQNYGAKKYDRVKKAMWITLILSALVTIVISALFLLAGKWLCLIFTKDQSVIEECVKMMNFLVPFYLTYISIEVLSGTTRGCGKSFVPMLISAFGICGIRIVWLFTACIIHHNIYTVMWSYPITWTVTSIAFWIYWVTGKWLKN